VGVCGTRAGSGHVGKDIRREGADPVLTTGQTGRNRTRCVPGEYPFPVAVDPLCGCRISPSHLTEHGVDVCDEIIRIFGRIHFTVHFEPEILIVFEVHGDTDRECLSGSHSTIVLRHSLMTCVRRKRTVISLNIRVARVMRGELS
jgi:hypothetical protein